MPSRDYHEALWRDVPEGLLPPDLALRETFLMEAVTAEDRVLDLGCGEGVFTARLAGTAASVVGADVAEEPLRRARARHRGLDLRLIDGEGRWDLPDASFDLVWAGEVIEHVADTAGWLSELRRVLRSGGRLLLSTPSLGRSQLLAAALSRSAFARRFDPRSDHLHHYSRATLAALIADFGFEQIAVRGAGGLPGARRVLLASAVRSRF